MSTSSRIPAVLLGLGLILAASACKKPEPLKAPEAPKPAPVAPAPDTEKREEEARHQAETARRQAEEAQAAARQRTAAAAQEARRADAAVALQDLHFNFDESTLSEASRAELQKVADFLKAHPRAQIQIEGHCDERGTGEYNLALGERRAHEALAYLKGLGVEEARLSTISYGKEKPLCQEATEDCWGRNRRDHFVLKP